MTYPLFWQKARFRRPGLLLFCVRLTHQHCYLFHFYGGDISQGRIAGSACMGYRLAVAVHTRRFEHPGCFLRMIASEMKAALTCAAMSVRSKTMLLLLENGRDFESILSMMMPYNC